MYIFDMNSKEIHYHSHNRFVHPKPFSFPIVKCQLCGVFMRKVFRSCATAWSNCHNLPLYDRGESTLMTTWLPFRWWKRVNSSSSRASGSIGHESEWRKMKTAWLRAGPQRRPPGCGQIVSRNDAWRRWTCYGGIRIIQI